MFSCFFFGRNSNLYANIRINVRFCAIFFFSSFDGRPLSVRNIFAKVGACAARGLPLHTTTVSVLDRFVAISVAQYCNNLPADIVSC